MGSSALFSPISAGTEQTTTCKALRATRGVMQGPQPMKCKNVMMGYTTEAKLFISKWVPSSGLSWKEHLPGDSLTLQQALRDVSLHGGNVWTPAINIQMLWVQYCFHFVEKKKSSYWKNEKQAIACRRPKHYSMWTFRAQRDSTVLFQLRAAGPLCQKLFSISLSHWHILVMHYALLWFITQ